MVSSPSRSPFSDQDPGRAIPASVSPASVSSPASASSFRSSSASNPKGLLLSRNRWIVHDPCPTGQVGSVSHESALFYPHPPELSRVLARVSLQSTCCI